MMPSLLIKFGAVEHLHLLLMKGILHCRSIKWFAEYEDGKVRGDEFEAVVKTRYMENVIMEFRDAGKPDAQWKKLNVINALYKEYHKEPLGNLYCLSKFPVSRGEIRFDPRNHQFGDGFVLIYNQVEFFHRLETSLTSMNVEFCRGDIDYLDLNKHTGAKGLYQKDVQYAYQSEYRVHIHRDYSDTFEFSIGNLEDIVSFFSWDELDGITVRKSGVTYECCPFKKVVD